MSDASPVPPSAPEAKNHRAAELNRTRFAAEGTFVVSLGSAPGSGTTTLLVRTLEALKARGQTLAVIAADQPATLGAVPADVATTAASRALDAEAIAQALVTHPAPVGGTLFIERGEAPGLDLGEAKRVVVTAVSERSELSIKDRDVFAAADAVLVNTALADAWDHAAMAQAFALAVTAGRLAYLAGLGPERDTAAASSPLTGFLE